MSPALAGRFLTTAPPGKSLSIVFFNEHVYSLVTLNEALFIFISLFADSRNISAACVKELNKNEEGKKSKTGFA